MTSGTAGLPVTLSLLFISEITGLPVDPSSVRLDITYGEEIGFVSDYAGPFFYAGTALPSSTVVYRTGVGAYSFIWQIPAGAPGGVYVANWTAAYGGTNWLGFENFPVAGGVPAVPATAGDTGYWTGSFLYIPPAGSTIAYTGASVPLGAVDATGVAWLIEELQGWDSPDVQGAGVIPRAGDHGAFASSQFYAARALTLTLAALAPTQALRDTARATLQQAIPVQDLTLFQYNEPVPKQMYVRRSGRIVETYDDLGHVQFDCVLIAPDPRKYSQQLNAQSTAAQAGTGFTSPFTTPLSWAGVPPTGAVNALNSGNFETRPVISIQGPCTGPALVNVNTGQVVSWTGLTLAAADQLIADFNVMQSYLNGTYIQPDLASSWWVLPPGTTTIQLAGTSVGSASMAAQWRSAWI